MIKYTISIILLTLAACILQQFMPAIGALYGARVLIFPLVFLCIAVTVEIPSMLGLAFLCGFLWDAQHTLGPLGGDPEIYPTPPESLHFGYSIILYGLMGFLMQGIQPLFRDGKWHLSAILSGIAILLYLLIEYLLINFVRGNFSIPAGALYRIYLTSALTMLFSPLVFWLLGHISDFCNHTIQYQGLQRRSKYLAT
ncbi:hypothetical protein HW115_11080 [Verrucomicrobiaceae bacterium N1E253]|uniref:Rod shape-determining protein MreD n=1 Tax=Oceaniferula marina TaxID=2748318 RepID=A0A851GPT3_9BACT|nr:hypothetical protein [Oceaniferula marina]NWK56154.1 hypothetical protein [Oceaniferula marina]